MGTLLSVRKDLMLRLGANSVRHFFSEEKLLSYNVRYEILMKYVCLLFVIALRNELRHDKPI